MKNTISLFSLILIFFATTPTFAQVKYGIKAGLNLANMADKDKDKTYSNDYKNITGFQFGVTAEYSLSAYFSIESGLLYSEKGFTKPEYKAGVDGQTADEPEIKIASDYLEIPVHAIYKVDLGSTKLLISAGPYAAYAIAGKLKANQVWFGENEDQTSRKIKIGNNEGDDIKAFDYGLNIGAGAEINQLTFGLQYGLSISNVAPTNNFGYELSNKVIGFSVGYKFGTR